MDVTEQETALHTFAKLMAKKKGTQQINQKQAEDVNQRSRHFQQAEANLQICAYAIKSNDH